MVLDVLESLRAALDELASADPAGLADGDSVIALHRYRDQLDAVVTRAVGAFDTAQGWSDGGARSAAQWLIAKCRLPRSTARAEVATARALRHLRFTEAAWAAGDLGVAQVRVLARARSDATADALADAEAHLVEEGRRLRFDHFSRLVAYWCQQVDADGADDTYRHQVEGRRLHLSQSWAGMYYGDLALDPIDGAIVAEELKRLEQQLFAADWADAKETLGRDPRPHELPRTPAQRRADALVEMAARSRTAPADGRRPAPLSSVLGGWETLRGRICQLADGSVIPPGALLDWLYIAHLERIVFDANSRVIDVGVTQRLFGGATRRAIQIRDQECFHPLCDQPAPDCQIDHITPYAAGGPTTQDNGRVACDYHNRARHQPHAPPPPPPT